MIMSVLGKALVISQFVITSNTPLEKRWEYLRPFFSPEFGSTTEFDAAELKDHRARKRDAIRGYIRVSPPPGVVFTITRKKALYDYKVLTPTPIPFEVSDLNEKGTFSWTVRTSKNDFGTPLTWKTPYRLARIVTDAMPWPGSPDMRIIEQCEASKTPLGERRIYITFLNGESWAIAFPPKDSLVPQPPSLPKLFIRGFRGKGFAKSDRIYGKAQEPVKAKKESHGEKTEKESKEEVPQEDLPNEVVWQMDPHKSFEMSGQYFIGSESPPPGGPGKCRYRYQEKDVDAGLLECHEVYGFHWIYLPLTCLKS
ncbi:MAG: hypothetical protein HYW48_07060 [Deltaproteobacteria bacterium]|nr:hypothetical protein [Deltaproteobacteria bacterium]